MFLEKSFAPNKNILEKTELQVFSPSIQISIQYRAEGAAVGAWVLLQPNKEEHTEDSVEGGGRTTVKSQSWEAQLKKEDPQSALAGRA